MGKKSKYPKYSAGTVEINGNTVASTTKKDKNTISSSYNMNDTEKSIYEGIQNNLSNSLQNLFSISDEKQKQWNEELDAYKRNGIAEINDIYTPMETSLKNDIASRFGNFDNSIFMDNLSNITDNKAKAVANLSDSLLMKQDELYSTELTNRLNYISLLNSLNTSMNNNILNYMQMGLTNAESGNNYNDRAYQASLQQQQAFANTLNSVANIGKTALSFANPIMAAKGNSINNNLNSKIDNGTRYC